LNDRRETMYDPKVGRWLEEDPIGFEAGDANLYRYVNNGPTCYVDSTGLKIVKAGWIDGYNLLGNEPQLFFFWLPDDYHGPVNKYIFDHYGAETHEYPMSPMQEAIVGAYGGDEATAKELIVLLNLTYTTRVLPAIPGLGYFFPETFGSHCVRWTNDFQSHTQALPAEQFGNKLLLKQYTLRYPRTGGPEHSILLVRRRGDQNSPVFGIDNGFLGHDNHLFDPSTVLQDESLPQETRDDLRDAVADFRGR
jgi:hypothetical protein